MVIYLGLRLILPLNNRWRWCCGRFNFRQRTLKLTIIGYFPSEFLSNDNNCVRGLFLIIVLHLSSYFSGVGLNSKDAFKSIVYRHNGEPSWNELIHIVLDSDNYATSHLR